MSHKVGPSRPMGFAQFPLDPKSFKAMSSGLGLGEVVSREAEVIAPKRFDVAEPPKVFGGRRTDTKTPTPASGLTPNPWRRWWVDFMVAGFGLGSAVAAYWAVAGARHKDLVRSVSENAHDGRILAIIAIGFVGSITVCAFVWRKLRR